MRYNLRNMISDLKFRLVTSAECSLSPSHTHFNFYHLWRPQMKELCALGFRDVSQCEEALRLSGGEVKGALSLLQRPLLEPFHQRIWTDQPEPPIDPKHPDKQVSFHTGTTLIARGPHQHAPSVLSLCRGCAGVCSHFTTCPAGGAVSLFCHCFRSQISATLWRM